MGGGIAIRLAKNHDVTLFNHHADKAQSLSDELEAKCCSNATEAVSHGELIILAIKPQNALKCVFANTHKVEGMLSGCSPRIH